MDQEKHWNRISSSYEDEIFDVFKSDKHKILPRYFRKHANKNHTAIDFGCGVGKAFKYLSPIFKSVLATDISDELIAIAREKNYSNITYKQADLTNKRVRFPLSDFAFCCNVIMLPEVERNLDMIVNIGKSLKPNGHAVIVVPSLESALYSAWQLIEWSKKEGIKPAEIDKDELSSLKNSKTDIVQGLIQIDNVTTKHYSREELYVLFERAGLRITALEKIEYEWNTEFNSPPAWMKAPYPWDWLIESKRM